MTNPSRYKVHERLDEIGHEGQAKINSARVTIVGCGGLGCFVAQSLVALGIGLIKIIDDDLVEMNNLQRQILFSEEDIGKTKVSSAKQRLTKQNSYCTIIEISERLNSRNMNLLEDSDIIVDCTDNAASRLMIDTFCSTYKIPMVYSGVKGFEGQVSVFNYKGGKSFRGTFPNTKNLFENENCQDSGVTAFTVALAGNLQACEVLKIILDKDEVLQGTLLSFNSLTNVYRILQLK